MTIMNDNKANSNSGANLGDVDVGVGIDLDVDVGVGDVSADDEGGELFCQSYCSCYC